MWRSNWQNMVRPTRRSVASSWQVRSMMLQRELWFVSPHNPNRRYLCREARSPPPLVDTTNDKHLARPLHLQPPSASVSIMCLPVEKLRKPAVFGSLQSKAKPADFRLVSLEPSPFVHCRLARPSRFSAGFLSSADNLPLVRCARTWRGAHGTMLA
jgi:hypothetical protein